MGVGFQGVPHRCLVTDEILPIRGILDCLTGQRDVWESLIFPGLVSVDALGSFSSLTGHTQHHLGVEAASHFEQGPERSSQTPSSVTMPTKH